MIKELTKEWLVEKNACFRGIEWFCGQEETDAIKVIENLIAEEKSIWANWVIMRVMDYVQRCKYTLFAVEISRHFYENTYPNSTAIKDVVTAIKMCIKNPGEKDKIQDNSYTIFSEAHANSFRVASVFASALCAAHAISSACTDIEADSAEHAARAADHAASAHSFAADTTDTGIAMLQKILAYGLTLLKEEAL